jgi:hypothetical protein
MRKSKELVLVVLVVMFFACIKDDDASGLSAPKATGASEITNTRFVANWLAVRGALNYELQVSTSSDFSADLLIRDNLWGTRTNVDSRQENTEYFYRVRASNDSNSFSDFSNVINVITLPDPPFALDASEFTTSSMIINWTAVSGIDKYQLFISSRFCPSQPGAEILEDYNGILVSGNSFFADGLESSTKYSYQIRALSEDRVSRFSNCIIARTL